MKNKAELSKQWYKIVSQYTHNEKLIKEEFQFIYKQYENRFYHNINHIKSIFKILELYSSEISDYDTLYFASWYHDIVYKAKKNNNEKKSALRAKNFLKKINYPYIKEVENLILATIKHQILNKNFDFQLFLDADLSILASEKADYFQYTQDVRKEYNHIQDEIYLSKRKEVLLYFLNQENIYLTAQINKRCEAAARNNLLDELKLILKQINQNYLKVTAAIITKNDQILIARRKKDKHLALKWEFPGGKINHGETPEECLKRELREEFDIQVKIEDFYLKNYHAYDLFLIELLSFKVKHISGDFILKDHDQIKWVLPQEMRQFSFAPADIPIVNKLLESK